jgi:hypothetical protein
MLTIFNKIDCKKQDSKKSCYFKKIKQKSASNVDINYFYRHE